MKKSIFLLPLVAVLGLAGCSSSSDSETASEASSTTAMPTWQSSESIQSTSMPASMTTAPSQTIGQVQTTYNNAQTAYNNVQQSVQSYGSQTESIGNCQVVRDSDGTPVYAQMTKGCYTDSQYTVGKTDTLFLISFLTAKTPAQIAAMNNISTATKLKVGQTLRVK